MEHCMKQKSIWVANKPEEQTTQCWWREMLELEPYEAEAVPRNPGTIHTTGNADPVVGTGQSRYHHTGQDHTIQMRSHCSLICKKPIEKVQLVVVWNRRMYFKFPVQPKNEEGVGAVAGRSRHGCFGGRNGAKVSEMTSSAGPQRRKKAPPPMWTSLTPVKAAPLPASKMIRRGQRGKLEDKEEKTRTDAGVWANEYEERRARLLEMKKTHGRAQRCEVVTVSTAAKSCSSSSKSDIPPGPPSYEKEIGTTAEEDAVTKQWGCQR